MTSITLYVPGLLGPDNQLFTDDIPDLFALSRLLSKASKKNITPVSDSRRLYELCGYQAHPGEDIPVAAITRMKDMDEVSDDIWIRADPVHLLAERDGIRVLPSHLLNLSRHDALALAGEIKELVNGLGWELEVPDSRRWYLRLPSHFNISTTEPDQITGTDLIQFMPKGEDKKIWHQVMNEVQMQLHQSEINQLREQKGELTVNSLWFWGCGKIPSRCMAKWEQAYSDDVLILGLARLSNFLCYALPESVDNLELNSLDNKQLFIHLPDLQEHVMTHDISAWSGALVKYEHDWFLPLLEYLLDKQIQDLTICTNNIEFNLKRSSFLKFWKLQRNLSSLYKYN